MSLTKTRIHAGVWEGVLQIEGGEVPELEVTHLEQPVHSVAITEIEDAPGQYLVRVAIPPDQLADGVQTFLISDKATGARLASFTVITGEPLEDDIRAELGLLRAELDMLKKAFRRHCVETT
ncbi:hypothetical protein [Frigidibacter sp. ROC022]|uniref:hypothetical protein n=1 Tax=Frigidibacter sp. ROC022 TaxID=2971796 RepID=UPI00215ADC0F|nr:hypothetical protein [Frigidibacter sp. ROC022]MCR8726503.1 hypothetical protein [Frigidibacter sp. ROC022]